MKSPGRVACYRCCVDRVRRRRCQGPGFFPTSIAGGGKKGGCRWSSGSGMQRELVLEKNLIYVWLGEPDTGIVRIMGLHEAQKTGWPVLVRGRL